MLQNEKVFLKNAFQKGTFSFKSFFSQYNYRNEKEGLSALKTHLYRFTKLVKPKGINLWADDLLDKVDRMMSSDEMMEYWEACRQKDNRNQMRENAQLEEAVYLRTRKRTLDAMLDKDIQENDSPKDSRSHNQEESDIYNDISFISTSTDTEFSSNTIESESIPYQRCILCFDELTKAKSKKLNYENIEQYDANLLGFEEILLLSSIKYKENESYLCDELEAEESRLVHAWIRACQRKTELDILPKSSSQLKLVSYLYIMHRHIMNEIPGLIKLVNHEEEFKLKHVFPLLELVFHDMSIRCDVASKVFDNTDTSLFATIRPDFLVMNNGTELVVIEVKPFNTSHSLLEADEIRIAELTKKILHRRMATAKSEKEFNSFGIIIAGDTINLYKHEFDNGEYSYQKLCNTTLPTMSHTFTYMNLTLEALFAFKELINATLPTEDALLKPYMYDVTKHMKPTTLYLL